MRRRQYSVILTPNERKRLIRLVSTSTASARKLTRARILLKADASTTGPSWSDARIAEAFDVHENTVSRVRQRFFVQGLTACLVRKPRECAAIPFKLNAVRLRDLVHQSPRTFGKNRSTWTLQLLVEVCAELGISGGRVCPETVRKTLNRMKVTWRRAQLWMTSPDPHYAEKKARRDRYISLASKHRDWVLGFVDEIWWSRIARPPLRAWGARDPLKLHVLSSGDDDPDPVAICCYGMLRQDTDRVMLRFVDGRPVGDVTTQFLEWVCRRLEVEQKTQLIVVWDDASWHCGGNVSDWIRGQNRRARRDGGVKIVPCPLPVMSPWLNNIETRWGPAKRAILEPDRKLTADEVVARVCDHFGSEILPYLKDRAADQE